MRSREEVIKEFYDNRDQSDVWMGQICLSIPNILEVLLDIRDLLNKEEEEININE